MIFKLVLYLLFLIFRFHTDILFFIWISKSSLQLVFYYQVSLLAIWEVFVTEFPFWIKQTYFFFFRLTVCKALMIQGYTNKWLILNLKSICQGRKPQWVKSSYLGIFVYLSNLHLPGKERGQWKMRRFLILRAYFIPCWADGFFFFSIEGND